MAETKNIPEASIEEFAFPETAKKIFIAETASFPDPYVDHESVRFLNAYEMNRALEKTLQIDDEKEDAKSIIQLIKSLKDDNAPDAFVIHNFPVDLEDSLLETPSDPKNYDSKDFRAVGKEGFVAEQAMLAFSTLIGDEILTNENLQKNNPIHHISPRLGKENEPSSLGSGDFPIHVELSHSLDSEMPDRIALLTLKNRETPTIIVPIHKIEKILREELGGDFEILKEPRFSIKPAAVNAGDSTLHHAPIIVLADEGKVDKWRIVGNRENLLPSDPKDSQAQKVIDKMHEILEREELKEGYVSKYGDYVGMDNRRIAHTRSPLSSQDTSNPETNRHLLRTYSKASPETHKILSSLAKGLKFNDFER